MTVFQAYCTSIEDDSTWRFVLTFTDSSVADQWWRAISGTPAIASYFNRISPQNYTHSPSSLNVYNFFGDARTQSFAASFKGRFWMTLIDDKIGGRGCPIIHNLHVANAISGNWFFIRSTADPTLFWYYNQSTSNTGLTVSKTGRSRFRISSVDSTITGKVLIGTDLVIYEIERTNQTINVDNLSDLYAGSSAHQFLFGDLNKNIRFNQANGLLQYVDDGSSGWTWELVE